MRKGSSFVCALALGLIAGTLSRPAAAQAFGNQGDIAFSAERLMGISFYDEGDQTGGETVTSVGLGIGHLVTTPYLLPRLGVDYFVIDSLSIGGSLGFGLVDFGQGPSRSGAMIAPRVGYALEFSKVFGFWPRGGFTYRNFASDEEFAFTLEAMFYAAPAEHFAVIFGPLMDLGIAGSADEAKNLTLISAGIVGWL
jgi:hypothetical protein